MHYCETYFIVNHEDLLLVLEKDFEAYNKYNAFVYRWGAPNFRNSAWLLTCNADAKQLVSDLEDKQLKGARVIKICSQETREATLKQSWESRGSLSCASSILLIYLRMPDGGPRSLQKPFFLLSKKECLHGNFVVLNYVRAQPNVEELSLSPLIYGLLCQHFTRALEGGILIIPGHKNRSVFGSYWLMQELWNEMVNETVGSHLMEIIQGFAFISRPMCIIRNNRLISL